MPFGEAQLATFTESDTDFDDNDYTALITWETVGGVPHVSSGSVYNNEETGQLALDGSYTYAQPGSYTAYVQLFKNDGSYDAFTVPVTVSDTVTAAPAVLPLDAMTAGSMVQVFAFSDDNPAAVSGDFTASTNWGDGSHDTQSLVVPADGGGFDVYALKTTAYAGSTQPVTVTITDSESDQTAVTDNAFSLDGGSALALPAGLPDNCNLTVSGTRLDLGGNSVLGTVTIDGGYLGGNLSGGTLTVTGGTAALGGTVSNPIVVTAGSKLYVSGTLSGSVTDDGQLDLNAANAGTCSASISGTGVLKVFGDSTIVFSGDNASSPARRRSPPGRRWRPLRPRHCRATRTAACT